MFILKRKFKKAKGIRTYYYVVETVYTKGKPRHKILKYLGAAENILKIFNEKGQDFLHTAVQTLKYLKFLLLKYQY